MSPRPWYRPFDPIEQPNKPGPTVKGRYKVEKLVYTSKSGAASNPTVKQGTAYAAVDRQVIETQGHPVSLLGKRTGLDIGGAFRNSRVTVEGGGGISVDRIITGNPSAIVAASGFYYASPEAAGVCGQALTNASSEKTWLESSLPPATDLQMLRDGATAISRVAPTNPLVDLSTSLAELFREGLPSLPGRSGGASGEYLNYQFGVAPLASDVRDLRSVLSRADALWRKYEENSGKGMRRRYTFPEDRTTSSVVSSYRVPNAVRLESGSTDGLTGLLIQPGTLWQRTETRKRTWFSGSFTYYLPDSPLAAGLARLDHLYGLQPGIDTAYQLTPWSWLIDYFANLGDVLENLNTFTMSGLVMPYAYVMSETTITTESRLDYEIWAGNGWKKATLTDTVTRKIQRRVPAHPFGFGVLDSGLTGKQQSILIALGLNRV